MLKNYLKIAFRNILKHKGYSLINLLGLAIGMACCILILLFVQHELSYDKFHENTNRIYRIQREGVLNGQSFHVPICAHPYGPALQADFPEIEQAVRVEPVTLPVRDQNDQYSDERIFFADQNVFQVFSFPLLSGDPATALAEPNAIVLTEKAAQRYLGEKQPIGAVLKMQYDGQDVSFKVTGILEPIPQNSHFSFDMLVSYNSLPGLIGERALQEWFNNNVYTYVLLAKNTTARDVENQTPAFLEKYMGPTARAILGPDIDLSKFMRLELFPLTDIHLRSNLEHEIEPNSSMATVYICSAIAVLILLIACINFMNLATARSANRANEVGMRKVVGANRRLLVMQFLGESIFMALLGLVLAVAAVLLLLPAFNEISGKELTLRLQDSPLILIGLIGIAVFVGIVSGSYPALFLSAFQPILILKGKFQSGNSSALLRKTLVVGQFVITIVLVISTIIVMQQLEFIKNKEMGFDKEHVVVIRIRDNVLIPKLESLKNELRQDQRIISAAVSSRVPGDRQFSDQGHFKEGEAIDLKNMVDFQDFAVDYDFLPTIGAEFVAGRNYSKEFATDSSAAYIINEAAAENLGWGTPEQTIGKKLRKPTSLEPLQLKDFAIIGVVKNFHFKSLRQTIEPIIIMLQPTRANYLSVRIRPGDIPGTLAFLETKMREFSPSYPFDYFFQDAHFDQQYRAEERLSEIFGYFTFLAIFIACLGLFGLAAFTAEQRTKEIGIRKVLGASVPNVTFLLSKDFLKWIIVANLIAWPVSWLAMRYWLQDFAYRIDIQPWVFFAAGTLALLIALATVSFQAIKAALLNPIDSLKYE